MPDLAELNLSIKSDSAKKASKDLDALDASGKKVDKTFDKVTKGSKELDSANDSLAQAIRDLTSQYQRIEAVLVKTTGKTTRAKDEFSEFDKIIKQNDRDMDRFLDDLQALDREMDDVAAGADKAGAAQNRLGDGVDQLKRRILQLVTVYAAYRAATKFVTNLADFEFGLVGVAKTANLSGVEIKQLGDSLRNLSLRFNASTAELLEIARAAGQVGVTGVDNLTAFSETVARLGSATDLSGEEATITLARLLNVTGETAANIGQLGAVITALGNSTAATEREIALMALEIGKAGAAFGLSSTEASGLAAAMASVGVQAELAGSTSFRAFRVIEQAASQGGDQLERLAELTGLTAKEFAALANQSTAGAFEAFIVGLGRAKEEGESLTTILEELNLQSVRDARVLLTLANNYEQFSGKLAEASQAAAEQTALIEESDRSNLTLRGSLQRLGNAFTAIQTDASGATGSLQAFTDLTSETLVALTGLETEGFEVSTTAEVLARAIKFAAAALAGFVIAKILIFLSSLVVGLGGVTAAFAALTAVIAANPLGALAIAVAAVAGALYIFSPAMRDATQDTRAFNLELERTEGITGKLTGLKAQFDQAFDGSNLQEQAQAVRNLTVQLDALAESVRADKFQIPEDRLDVLKRITAGISEAQGRPSDKPDEKLLSFFVSQEEVRSLRARVDTVKQIIGTISGDDDLAKRLFAQDELAAALVRLDGFSAKASSQIKKVRDEFGDNAVLDREIFFGKNSGLPGVEQVLDFTVLENARKEFIKITEALADELGVTAEQLQDEFFNTLEQEIDTGKLEGSLKAIRDAINDLGLDEASQELVQTERQFREMGKSAGLTGDALEAYVVEAVALTAKLQELEKQQDETKRAQEEAAAAADRAAEAYIREQNAINNAVTALDQRLALLRREVELVDETADARRIELTILRERQRLLAQGVPEESFGPRLSEMRELLTQQSAIQNKDRASRRGGKADPAEDLRREIDISRQLLEIQNSRVDANLELEESILRAQGPIASSGITPEQRELEELIRLQDKYRSSIDDTAAAQKDYEDRLARTADVINDAFSGAIASILAGTASAKDAARQLGQELLTLFIRQQVLSPLVSAANPGGLFASFFTPSTGATPSANGNAFGAGGVYPFAAGGVFGPGMFTFGGGKLGTMGEEGPEAVMPLQRDSRGRLGVVSPDGGGGGSRPVNVTIVTRDAESFRRSRIQVGEDLSRAVNRRVPRGAV